MPLPLPPAPTRSSMRREVMQHCLIVSGRIGRIDGMPGPRNRDDRVALKLLHRGGDPPSAQYIVPRMAPPEDVGAAVVVNTSCVP
jgi:hypothetical protein